MPLSTDGRWTGPTPTPGGVMPVHAALLRTGELLLFSGRLEGSALPYDSWLWNPDQPTNTATRQPFPPRNPANPAVWPNVDDLFCSHHVVLEDGRLLVVGGAGALEEGDARGIRVVYIFDPDADAMARQPRWQRQSIDMTEGRWYPTAVMLADGRVVVMSGRRQDGAIAQTVEVLGPPNYAPQTAALPSGAERRFPIYPGLHLVRGGRVFHTGTNWRYEAPAVGTVALQVTGATGAWNDWGVNPIVVDREEGMSVLLPPAQDGKILLLGGTRWFNFTSNRGNQLSAMSSSSEPRSAEILDTQASPPRWTRIGTAAAPPLRFPRINVNAVLLPDGTVFVVGGHDGFKGAPHTPSNQAEIYDPVANAFTPVATMTRERQYHSVALLLPDGRVFCGGGSLSDWTNQMDMEFYEPPYFFNPDDSLAARPTITSIAGNDGPPDQIAYGRQFIINTPNAGDIRRVVLMRPGAPTHHTDSDQRYVPLEFVPGPGVNQLTVAVASDPSVAPPGYYLLWIVARDSAGNARPCQRARFVHLTRQQCYVITDRSTFSRDEVAPAPATTSFENSFYVVMDGFTPAELGITSATPTLPPAGLAPAVTFRRADNSTVAEMTATAQQLLYEVPTLPPGVRQRFTFKYAANIAGTAPFFQADGTTPIETQNITLQATQGAYTCRGTVRLTHQPNPFMLDGATPWLSVDLRVFKTRQGDPNPFGRPTPGDPTAAINFIQGVLADWNAAPATGAAQFTMISTDQIASQLDLLESRSGGRVFNFAIAQVHYRGRTLNAENVRVFFRLFTTAATGLDYRTDTTYRRELNPDGDPISVLGLQGGAIATIPFFAQARVNPTLQSMTEQRDTTNRRTINATGGAETTAYFGCWLDFNQTAQRFPLYPGGFGPYTTGLRSIQELIRGRHQCLAAEVYFATDPIPDGATPDNNDNLSQRNLAILESDNPGNPASHRVQHTFEVKPSLDRAIVTPDMPATQVALEFRQAQRQQPQLLIGTGLDELMIRWGNLPRSTKVTLYLPGVGADEILRLAALRIGPERLERVDADTLRCHVGDVTYVPLPGGRTTNIPGLLTFDLPPDVKRDQTFTVLVQQVAGATNVVLGTVEFVIRVSTASVLLAEEERTLSVMRHIAEAIPAGDRWYPVFQRYVGQIADRVRGFGGDPDQITPSPDGTGTPDGRGERDQHKLSLFCARVSWLVSALLAAFVVALGLTPGAVASALSIAFGLGLLAAVFVWQSRCKPPFCYSLLPVLLGAGLGGGILGLLMLGGWAGSSAALVLATAGIIVAATALTGIARRCWPFTH